MGFGMGASIGAQVANPKAVVFNIAGDGSFGTQRRNPARAAKKNQK